MPNRIHRRGHTAWLIATLAIVISGGVAPVRTAAPSCETPVAATAAPASEPAHLTVFAAASLTDAFEAIAADWQATHPGSELTLSFDASSALRAQIEEGAPVDVFVSADERDAQALVDACLAPGPITPPGPCRVT